jgi:hypothetical protein
MSPDDNRHSDKSAEPSDRRYPHGGSLLPSAPDYGDRSVPITPSAPDLLPGLGDRNPGG